jgi:hypothetical protein
MRAMRRAFGALMLALPVWLALPAAASAQVLSADVNGDGVRDRIETRRAPAELVIRLSTLEAPQHLAASGSILDVVVADIDHDGDSDLIATAAGRRHVRLLVWTNAGRGRFVSRVPRDALSCDRLGHRKVATPGSVATEDDLCGDASRLLVLPAIGLKGHAMPGEPLRVADGLSTARPRHSRRSPRGPPSTLLCS